MLLSSLWYCELASDRHGLGVGRLSVVRLFLVATTPAPALCLR
jgi:hypothetical protein